MDAFVTVTDAAGRTILRRPATEDEIDRALRDATTAELEGEAALLRVAQNRRGRRARNTGDAA